ncbi:patched domain-containing protein 3-like isoform X2 [Oratosquilla oratoria]
MNSSEPSSKVNSHARKKRSRLEALSSSIVGGFEYAFYSYGLAIARRPFVFILVCLSVTATCSIGLTKFKMEIRPFKLWIPQNSDFLKVYDWQGKNFPSEFRIQAALYEADNILDKRVLLEMLQVHENVENTTTSKGIKWRDVCARVPTLVGIFRKKREIPEKHLTQVLGRRRRDVPDPTIVLDKETYCDYLQDIESLCKENSILEIWGYDRQIIESLTPEQIIQDLNETEDSAVFGLPTNFTMFLGGIERDSDGKIIKAKAAMQRWITRVDLEAVASGNYIDDTGTGMEVDPDSFEWESSMVETVINSSNEANYSKIYLMSSSSFGKIAEDTIQGDVTLLTVGFATVFTYVQIMLGKFNKVEQRPLLSLLGLLCVGMATLISYGLCSAFDIPYGPVNSIMPFLLLGLGIDDMFVIMQSWNNLSPKEKQQHLAVRIGATLKHAGVSITVTSITDFMAFAIGAGTVLPALRSFCLYAAVGIAAVYFLQATFFVACLTLDQKRLEDNRHGLFWFWKMKSFTPNECSKKDLCQNFFSGVYSKFLLKLPVKISVLVFTAGLIGVSSWGLSNLRQEFEPIWFLPHRSYLFQFFMKQKEYFPTLGKPGVVYLGNFSYYEEIDKIDTLVTQLKASPYVGEVDDWYSVFKKYMEKHEYPLDDPDMNQDDYDYFFSLFLYSPAGSEYRVKNFKFNGNYTCYDTVPSVHASSIEYKHIQLSGSGDKIAAMNEVKNIVKSLNFSGYAKPWAQDYSGWETDEIIEAELYRNIGLAMFIVFIMTLSLIASLTTSLMVLLCVILTLLDVGALIHWWGLTIDTVSCVDLVLAIGLCVDYAAHIGHSFMIHQGTRDRRVHLALSKIGPAVLNGGFSTFLAFSFLAGSDSHVFITFFKVFFAVCLFGLYHGLVFLPVLLSFIGPNSYFHSSAEHDESELEEMDSTNRRDSVHQIKENESGIETMQEDNVINSLPVKKI